ncbi:MAG: HD-GYP domain-containing protein [Lachnospiraceae bacterium]|nr:HD-GYP domain-containing protein [Lachnospiraceae bacterium]
MRDRVMTFEDFENIFTLFCTIVGLLYCLFKYIERPKRRYLYLIIFFLGHFFSDYYWGIYVLTMHTYPTVSEFMAYLGWNIAYIFLFLVIFRFRRESKKFFHPLMLWPLLTNIPLFRVAKYSKMIARRAGYSESKQDEIYMMGLLHDVGKIGVPDEVLNYPGKLSSEDFEKIKKHPVTGFNILQSIKERSELSIGARWHHERYDGKGYPDGIAGEKIPEEARIIAVADAYDAMSSKRNYRDMMPQEKVREEIEKGSGTQFDPRFAKIMLQMMDEDPEYSLSGEEHPKQTIEE